MQTVEVTGTRLRVDEVTLVVDGQDYQGWTTARITRGIERMPSDFTLTVTEVYPLQPQYLQIRAGQSCEVWIGKNRVVTGFIDRVSPSLSAQQHNVEIVGRGACRDLVDCMAEWPGGQIMHSSVLNVAAQLAEPFGIPVSGEAGPPVGGGRATLIPQLVLSIGETPWEIIERLCRIAGLLAYEGTDGGLILAANPETTRANLPITQGGFTWASSGFAEGVNVQSARATFSMDQRFSNYRAYVYSFDSFRDAGIGDSANLLAEFKDEGVPTYRPKALLVEHGKSMALDNAVKRAQWEAKRQWGRSHAVTLTTDSWRDSSGTLYAPNTMADLTLPTLKIPEASWLISEVTYSMDGNGTACEVTLMPPAAFDVQPTLPPYAIPADVARLPAGLGRP